MENREQQILTEIKSLMASVRSQLELLDIKMSEFQQLIDPQDIDVAPLDLDIDSVIAEVEPVDAAFVESEIEPEVVQIVEPVIEVTVDDDLPFDDAAVAVEISDGPQDPEISLELECGVLDESDPVVEAEDVEAEDVEAEVEAEAEVQVETGSVEADTEDVETEVEEEIEVEEAEESVFGPEPELDMEPDMEPEPVQEQVIELETVEETIAEAAAPVTTVIDTMTMKQAWRTDMPGLPVKDVRSAISLNDRVLFINYLFGEDPMKFMDVLNKINQMTSLDEAVSYLAAEHPEWDFGSDVVYRFMMAVRRRIR